MTTARKSKAPSRSPAGPPVSDNVPPSVRGTVNAMRSVGYRIEDAVADIVDNSIAAEATLIDVVFEWNGPASWVAVADNGRGMTDGELVEAMRIGTEVESRGPSDLGRFGMGLKTASFSQSKHLSIATRSVTGDRRITKAWDLDEILRTGEWTLRRSALASAEGALRRLNPARGTVVVWSALDRPDPGAKGDKTAQNNFLAQIDRTASHLGMVFHRFLVRAGHSAVKITVNGRSVPVWDPFDGGRSGEILPSQQVLIERSTVTIQPYLLPNPNGLSSLEHGRLGGPKGWVESQGFYVYRRDRLVVAGGWLSLCNPADKFVQARISVDFPPDLDHLWQIDIAKTSVKPPDQLKRELVGMARRTRDRAARSGKKIVVGRVRTIPPGLVSVWTVADVDGSARLRANRDHPVVAALLLEDAPLELRKRVLRLLEESLPVDLNVKTIVRSTGQPEGLSPPPEELLQLAQAMVDHWAEAGVSKADAWSRLRQIEPFYRYRFVAV